jgi:hypothetical protein
MSFFEPPPPPPEPPPSPPSPEWFGPAENVLPDSFPLDLVLARTDEVILYVFGGRAYPNGWKFTFGIRFRTPRHGRHDPMAAWHGHDPDATGAVRIGYQLSDGRKATVFDRRAWFGEDAPSPEAVLRPGGGGGGSHSWEFDFWAWPLPPAGALDLVVEWPAEGIPLTRTALDTGPIREAAGRAQELWPPAEPRGGWTRFA